MSLDGYIDDTSARRLLLSNDEDFDRVDELRASCDAILVGANTVRRDNPSLLVKSAARRRDRQTRGEPPNPIKVTLTTGTFDPALAFFTTGGAALVYCPDAAAQAVRADLGDQATVVTIGSTVNLAAMLADLADRGIQRLVVEGGGTLHTRLLTDGLADELRLAIAPFFVGQAQAPRFVNPGTFPHDVAHPLIVDEVRQIGDIVYVRYLVSERVPQA